MPVTLEIWTHTLKDFSRIRVVRDDTGSVEIMVSGHGRAEQLVDEAIRWLATKLTGDRP
jgi:hypothetical protein